MKTDNIRLLGIYYATQKILLNNLAAPLGHGLKPIIKLEDYDLVASKAMPYLKTGVDKGKLETIVEQIFTQINSGEIKHEQYIGHEFSLEETLDQFELHDGFVTLHSSFFQSIESISQEDYEKVSDNALTELTKLKLGSAELGTLKELFMRKVVRSPLTLDIEDLQDVVDCMYESSCTVYGPTQTDQLLSNAIKQTSEIIPDFNGSIFL